MAGNKMDEYIKMLEKNGKDFVDSSIKNGQNSDGLTNFYDALNKLHELRSSGISNEINIQPFVYSARESLSYLIHQTCSKEAEVFVPKIADSLKTLTKYAVDVEIGEMPSKSEINNSLLISGISLASQFEDLSQRQQEKANKVRRMRDKHFHNNDYIIKRDTPKLPNRFEGETNIGTSENPAIMPEEILGSISRITYNPNEKRIFVKDKRGNLYEVVEDRKVVDIKRIDIHQENSTKSGYDIKSDEILDEKMKRVLGNGNFHADVPCGRYALDEVPAFPTLT